MKKFFILLFIVSIIILIAIVPNFLNKPPPYIITDSHEITRDKDRIRPIIPERDTIVNVGALFCEENTDADSSPPNKKTQPPDKDGWNLVWHDEFDQGCLDPAKWNAEDGDLDKNNELQYYSPTNIVVKDDLLKLVSKNERFKQREYTSGAVHTKKKFELMYGKVEMRAKLPLGQGLFPAFWMMANNEQTWLPEIDIMEMLGHRPDEIWMVSHWLENGELRSVSNYYKGEDFTKDFHTFSIEWTPESLTWFIDDIERFRTTTYIPHEKMYLYLNTAVGGNWPGPPDDTTVFPAHFGIDYVRVYQKNNPIAQH